MARKHVSLRINEKSDTVVRELADEYDLPHATVLRAAIATGFTHFTELRANLEAIRKAQ
jgi:DNA-binding MurR/RpiR family transcriptional regulator